MLNPKFTTGHVVVASPKGGVDIEGVAKETPEDIFTLEIDVNKGFSMEEATALAGRLGFEVCPAPSDWRSVHCNAGGGGGARSQGTWASRTRKHREAGYGRPEDGGAWAAKQSNDPRNNQHNPQYANYWAPLTCTQHIPPHPAQPRHTNDWAPRTRKRHQQEHRPQRPTERSDPTQHAKGRTGDCPGPRRETTTRRNVTQGEGGALSRCGLALHGFVQQRQSSHSPAPYHSHMYCPAPHAPTGEAPSEVGREMGRRGCPSRQSPPRKATAADPCSRPGEGDPCALGALDCALGAHKPPRTLVSGLLRPGLTDTPPGAHCVPDAGGGGLRWDGASRKGPGPSSTSGRDSLTVRFKAERTEDSPLGLRRSAGERETPSGMC